MSDFVKVIAIDPKEPGMRLRLERFDGECNCTLSQLVWPEQVNNPGARQVREMYYELCLTLDEQRWLRDALTEMLEKGG